MLLNAQFVWRELPIRYAHRVKQLRSLPFGLHACDQIQQAARSYTAHAEQMHEHPKPVDAETRASFDKLLRDTQPALLKVPGLIGEALAQRKLPESDQQVRGPSSFVAAASLLLYHLFETAFQGVPRCQASSARRLHNESCQSQISRCGGLFRFALPDLYLELFTEGRPGGRGI
jgi:hypothetical protein